jgi:hypothetical protein
MEKVEKKVVEKKETVANDVVVDNNTVAEEGELGMFVSDLKLFHSGIYIERQAYPSKDKKNTYYDYFIKYRMFNKDKRCNLSVPKQSFGTDEKGNKIYAREADGYELLENLFESGAVELCFEIKKSVDMAGNKDVMYLPFAYAIDNDFNESAYPLKTISNADASVLKTVVNSLKRKGLI